GGESAPRGMKRFRRVVDELGQPGREVGSGPALSKRPGVTLDQHLRAVEPEPSLVMVEFAQFGKREPDRLERDDVGDRVSDPPTVGVIREGERGLRELDPAAQQYGPGKIACI